MHEKTSDVVSRSYDALVPVAPKPVTQRLGHRRELPKRATSTTVTGAGVAKPPSPPSWLAKPLLAERRQLERELLLTPRAQRQSGVTVDPASPPATLHALEGGRGLTAAQRRDLDRDRRRARVAGADAWETP